MLEMSIESIRVNLINYQRVVVLRVKESNRYLPIWIGPAEADAIAQRLHEYSTARPMTHDLLNSVISTLGATVDSIIVSDLANDTFYAKIVLQVNGGSMEIDSRPSDAIALAVRAEAPIYAVDDVVSKAGVEMDEETGRPILPSRDRDTPDEPRPLEEQELQRLSAFTDFVDTLNLDDLGQEEKQSEK